MMVDIKVFYTFNQCDNLISCVLMVDDTVDGKDNQMEATMQVGDDHDVSLQLESSSMKAGV